MAKFCEKVDIIYDGMNGPLISVVAKPELVISVGQMITDLEKTFNQNVVDPNEISSTIDDLYEKATALIAHKNQPDVIDERMFTPAKQRPAKRRPESSDTLVKRTRKPRSKKIKNEPTNDVPIAPTRVLRSRTILTDSATSSINSTANTVIEASGYSSGTYRKPRVNQKKGTTTPLQKQFNTPIRNDKNADNSAVKLTPKERKEQLEADRRAVLLQKIEEKDRRIEKNKAEKHKMDLLKKAQSELNRTPRPYQKMKNTPISSKQIPKRDLNVTPLSSGPSSLSNFPSGSSNKNQVKILKNSILKKDSIMKKEISKPANPISRGPPTSENIKTAVKNVPNVSKMKPAAAKTAIEATILPSKQATTNVKSFVMPVVERHVDIDFECNLPIVQDQPKEDNSKTPIPNRISQIDLSPISVDNNLAHPKDHADWSVLKAVHFDNLLEMEDIGKVPSSTLLGEAIQHESIQHFNPIINKTNKTFDVNETKENNYEITAYMNTSTIEDQAYRNGKIIPPWARGSKLKQAIKHQFENKINNVDWGKMRLTIPLEAFDNLKADPRLLEDLANRDESIVWNMNNL